MKRILIMVLLLVIMTAQISFADVATEMFNLIVVQNADSGPGPVTTAQLTINFEDEDGISLSTPSITTHNVGEVVTVNPPAITGYTPITGPANITILAGGSVHTIVYRANAIPPGPTPTAKLTINYVDENGVVIKPQTSDTHNVGSIVNVIPPTIVGYTAQTPAANITVLAGGSVHTIVYKVNAVSPPAKVTLTIRYKDSEGNMLSSEENSLVDKGVAITITPKEISGYTTPAPKTVTPSGNMIADFVYNEIPEPPHVTEVKVTIKYEDEYGNKLLADKIFNVTKSTSIYVEAPAISGYKALNDNLYYTIGELDLTIIVKYKSNPAPVSPGGGGGGGSSTPVTEKVIEPTPVVPPVEVPAVPSTGSSDSKSVIEDKGQQIVTGYPDGSFKPDLSITRAEAVAIMYNLILPETTEESLFEFSDVDTDDWYYYMISTMTSEKYPIFVGYPEGDFKPGKTITRAELTSVITKLGYGDMIKREEDRQVFKDVANHWARTYIAKAKEDGIISSNTDLFFPNNNATRAEASTMIVNAIGRPETVPDRPTFVDVPKDHWAYPKIESIVRETIVE